MLENVNTRIIKKIRLGGKPENLKTFLIELIREEHQRSNSRFWQFQDFYKEKVREFLFEEK